ncbi:nucleoside/nucleotide kinase family protein [Saccharopolyspora hattusasensis]|uniref:nucleoside/nucleotide kinase family protein n=1 Tax=Saccharopolyspora hattusasensis TaxID=1128679 RepID=UPI003D964A71
MVGYVELVKRARELAASGQRKILGIAGAPGAGKGTVAERVLRELGGSAVLVPMDGFHLANAQLRRLGRADRKGAPDTFDAAGYVALLRRIRECGPDSVYAPEFRREIEESYAGAIPIEPGVPLVITEGNYLLLDMPPWSAVRDLLDEAWFLAPDDDVRVQRLIARHISYGRTPDEAEEWVYGSDERNAAVVAASRERADLVVVGDPQ